MYCEQLSYSYYSSPAAKLKLWFFSPKSYPAKHKASSISQEADILKKLNLVSKQNFARPPKPNVQCSNKHLVNTASLLQAMEFPKATVSTAQEAAGLKVGKATQDILCSTCSTLTAIPKSVAYAVIFLCRQEYIWESIYTEVILACIIKQSAKRETFMLWKYNKNKCKI